MPSNSASVAQAISDAVDDEDVEAILFRVDSPGGSYVASDTVHREVRRAREAGKPVIVSMGNFAASGGYFVAMAADKIVAHPGTVTGSIGVVAGKFVLTQVHQVVNRPQQFRRRRRIRLADGPHRRIVGRRLTENVGRRHQRRRKAQQQGQ